MMSARRWLGIGALHRAPNVQCPEGREGHGEEAGKGQLLCEESYES